MPRKRTRRQDGDLLFINLSHPDDHNLPTNQTQVRQHAMRRIGLSRRKQATGTGSVVASRHVQPQEKNDDDRIAQMAHWELQGTRGLKPPRDIQLFTTMYQTTPRERELLYFMQAEEEYTVMAFRFLWIGLGLRDPAARDLILANAALALARHHGFKASGSLLEHPESITYYSKSVNALNSRLGPSAGQITEGMIITVLGFSCYDTRIRAWDRWAIHMDGLERMIKTRGGFQGLSPQVVYMVVWMEMTGASHFDIYPRFPFPDGGEALSDIDDLSEPSYSGHEELRDVEMALRLLRKLCDEINDLSEEGLSRVRDMALIKLLGPVSHFLLSMPRLHEELDQASFDSAHIPDVLLTREMVRLASLVLLAQLKRILNALYSDLSTYLQRFNDIIHVYRRQITVTSGLSRRAIDLRLWSLVTVASALVREQDETQMEAILEEIRQTMILLKIREWDQVLVHINSVASVRQIHDPSLEALKGIFHRQTGVET